MLHFAEKAPMAAQQGSPSSLCVLIVDDDPDMLRLCSSVLEGAGFKVLQASGSSEALKICSERYGPIALVIVDLFLPPPGLQLTSANNPFPRTHGHELVRKIITMKPQARALLISAYSDEELKQYGIHKLALPFLRKPFTRQELLNRVHEALAAPPVVVESDKEDKDKEIEWYD
jgi:two-component system cell cycle sensor histidine kinase/response regulator CckA